MDEKDTSRFDDREKAPTPSPFRASNTFETLRPREVLKADLAKEISSCITPSPPSPEEVARWEKHLAENPLPGATFVRKADSIVDGNAKYLVGNEGNEARQLEQKKLDHAADQIAGGPHVKYTNVDVPADFNVLPVNFPASTGLGGKKLDLPKETIFRPQAATLTGVQGELAKPVKVSMPRPMPAMEVRVLRLEEQMDALLDRIAKYNTKSSHKI